MGGFLAEGVTGTVEVSSMTVDAGVRGVSRIAIVDVHPELGAGRGGAEVAPDRHLLNRRVVRGTELCALHCKHVCDSPRRYCGRGVVAVASDRKSTRLNSSHRT